MANRELLEWLGITFADLLVYLATGAIVAMFLLKAATVLTREPAVLAGS